MTSPTGTRLHPTGRLIPADLDEALVRAVVDLFYARARADDVIGPVFNARASRHHCRLLVLDAARHRPLFRPADAQAPGAA